VLLCLSLDQGFDKGSHEHYLPFLTSDFNAFGSKKSYMRVIRGFKKAHSFFLISQFKVSVSQLLKSKILHCWDFRKGFYSPNCWIITRCVNFINILRTNFLYKRHFGSFFYVYVTREKLLKQHSYKKINIKCWWNWILVRSVICCASFEIKSEVKQFSVLSELEL